MKETNAQTVIEKLKEAVYFSICYKPKKYNGKPVYRNAKWDDKCKIGNGYIIYYDRDRGAIDVQVASQLSHYRKDS